MKVTTNPIGLEVQATDSEATHFVNLLLRAWREKRPGQIYFSDKRNSIEIRESGKDATFLASVWHYGRGSANYSVILVGTPEENAYVKRRVKEFREKLGKDMEERSVRLRF